MAKPRPPRPNSRHATPAGVHQAGRGKVGARHGWRPGRARQRRGSNWVGGRQHWMLLAGAASAQHAVALSSPCAATAIAANQPTCVCAVQPHRPPPDALPAACDGEQLQPALACAAPTLQPQRRRGLDLGQVCEAWGKTAEGVRGKARRLAGRPRERLACRAATRGRSTKQYQAVPTRRGNRGCHCLTQAHTYTQGGAGSTARTSAGAAAHFHAAAARLCLPHEVSGAALVQLRLWGVPAQSRAGQAHAVVRGSGGRGGHAEAQRGQAAHPAQLQADGGGDLHAGGGAGGVGEGSIEGPWTQQACAAWGCCCFEGLPTLSDSPPNPRCWPTGCARRRPTAPRPRRHAAGGPAVGPARGPLPGIELGGAHMLVAIEGEVFSNLALPLHPRAAHPREAGRQAGSHTRTPRRFCNNPCTPHPPLPLPSSTPSRPLTSARHLRAWLVVGCRGVVAPCPHRRLALCQAGVQAAEAGGPV